MRLQDTHEKKNWFGSKATNICDSFGQKSNIMSSGAYERRKEGAKERPTAIHS